MYVRINYHEEEGVIHLRGRSDPPDCGTLQGVVRPGEVVAGGLSFDDLVKLDAFETDPVTQEIVATHPRQPLPAAPAPLPIPDWLRKKPAP